MNKVTITSTTGPGMAVTSQVINDVKALHFSFERRVLIVDHGIRSSDYSYDDIATVTFSISGESNTVVVS